MLELLSYPLLLVMKLLYLVLRDLMELVLMSLMLAKLESVLTLLVVEVLVLSVVLFSVPVDVRIDYCPKTYCTHAFEPSSI